MNKNVIENIFKKYMQGTENTIITNKCISMDTNNYEMFVKEILTEYELLVAELKAKVYAYEKIIANSNFKILVEEPKDSDD